MSYNVTLNKKLPEQGVYDQLLGGHVVNRKQAKLYPRSGAGPFSPTGQNTIQFRLPSHGYIDTLRSYMEYTLEIDADVRTIQRTFNSGVTKTVADTTARDIASELSANPLRLGPAGLGALEDVIVLPGQSSTYNDPCAYILGGYNGSTASPFKLFRILYDGEPIEYIDNYNGLVALLTMNISDSYRRSALGHMQFLSPRGSKEMILNALARGDSRALDRYQPSAAPTAADVATIAANAERRGWNGALSTVGGRSASVVKTAEGDIVRTRYKNLMHLPVSGVMANSKNLPVKFMGNVDMEFELASVAETLQVASSQAVNKYVSTHVGAVAVGTNHLEYKSANPGPAVNEEVLYNFADYDNTESTQKAAIKQVIANNIIGATVGTCLTSTYLNSIRYRIVDPVYHLEIVYMSEAYDSAFADALTRGVTYSFETYTATNAPVNGNGIVHVPISKTSIKAVYSGFINNAVTNSLITNSWQFFNPDLEEYQCKFGGKLVPLEPMKVKQDKGLMSLMMYLKAVNMHYNPLAGFAYGWSYSDPSFMDGSNTRSASGIDTAVTFGMLGATDPGPSTWCGGSGVSAQSNDLQRMKGTFPSTNDPTKELAGRDFISMFGTRDFDGLTNVQRPNADKKELLGLSTWTYHVGAFAIGLDLETEQDALSGINTAGSTAQLQWSFKFDSASTNTIPRGNTTLYTWLLHDKALRLEPFGRASVIVD